MVHHSINEEGVNYCMYSPLSLQLLVEHVHTRTAVYYIFCVREKQKVYLTVKNKKKV